MKTALQDTYRQWLDRSLETPAKKNPFEMSFDEFEKLPRPEQSEIRRQAFSRNRAWINEQLQKYRAEWIIVIGGKVVKSSSLLDDEPLRSEIRKMGQKSGLTPFLFARELMIEESFAMNTESRWTEIGVVDFYPNEEKWAEHLGAQYRYVTPPLQISVRSASQGVKLGVFRPRVVYDWAKGPFVLINRNRAALVGRNLLLQLGLDVLLKGTERKTLVM